MAQFYLFRRTLNGAVLSVPKHFEWRSSIYSGAYSMKQFYLFRRTINGVVLFVPLKGFWNCSTTVLQQNCNCSLPIVATILPRNAFKWSHKLKLSKYEQMNMDAKSTCHERSEPQTVAHSPGHYTGDQICVIKIARILTDIAPWLILQAYFV